MDYFDLGMVIELLETFYFFFTFEFTWESHSCVLLPYSLIICDRMCPSVLILAIDTSSRTGSVALLRDHQLIAEVSGHEEAPYSTRLFHDVEVLKSNAQFELSQIELFAVASGPGSFTGLRIGLTAVKAWSEVYGRPIAAVSALEAICAQSVVTAGISGSDHQILAPFFDGRRGQLFGALYKRTVGNALALQLLTEESILSPEEFLDLVKGKIGMDLPRLLSPARDLIPAALLRESLPEVAVEIVSPVLAPTIGRLGFDRAKRGDMLNALELDANYVRRSDAEAKWKDS
jgi:tRNA threonylcarbamoyladenosine biosynthesis protein TsaB